MGSKGRRNIKKPKKTSPVLATGGVQPKLENLGKVKPRKGGILSDRRL